MSYWSSAAAAAIGRVHAELPAEASLAERQAAVDAAYPFGPRQNWPYRTWLRHRRAYLEKFGLKPRRAPKPTALDLLPRDPVTGRPVIR